MNQELLAKMVQIVQSLKPLLKFYQGIKINLSPETHTIISVEIYTDFMLLLGIGVLLTIVIVGASFLCPILLKIIPDLLDYGINAKISNSREDTKNKINSIICH